MVKSLEITNIQNVHYFIDITTTPYGPNYHQMRIMITKSCFIKIYLIDSMHNIVQSADVKYDDIDETRQDIDRIFGGITRDKL